MKGLSPQLRAVLNKEKKHKYGAVRSMCLYGHDHDSKKEAMWCVKLHELQKEGRIFDLRLQPIYEFTVNGVYICRHIPDFFYQITRDSLHPWEFVVLEVKGMPTPEWKLKQKLFCALYPQINYVVV